MERCAVAIWPARKGIQKSKKRLQVVAVLLFVGSSATARFTPIKSNKVKIAIAGSSSGSCNTTSCIATQKKAKRIRGASNIYGVW